MVVYAAPSEEATTNSVPGGSENLFVGSSRRKSTAFHSSVVAAHAGSEGGALEHVCTNGRTQRKNRLVYFASSKGTID